MIIPEVLLIGENRRGIANLQNRSVGRGLPRFASNNVIISK